MAIGDYAPWKWGKKDRAVSGDEDWAPVDMLHRQIGSLLEDFMGGFRMEPFGGKGFTPRINVSEDEQKVYVTAELPGLDEKEVEVTLSDNALTIRGEKKQEREEKDGKDARFVERSYGYFQRSIPLSCEIDSDHVDAVFKKGVLSVTLTKTKAEQSKSKRITIRQ